MDKFYKTTYKNCFMKPKRWTGEETKTLLNALAARKNFEAPTAQIYYTQLLKDTNLKTSWNILYRKVRNLKSSFRKAEEWAASAEARALKDKGEEEMSYYNLQLRNRCRHYYRLKDIFGGKGLMFYKKHTSKESQKNSTLQRMQSSDAFHLPNANYGSQYEITLFSDPQSMPPRRDQLQENFEVNFSEILELLSKRKNDHNDPEIIEYEFEARKYEKEIEFRSRKQKMEFEIRKQELEIRRMELEKNEEQKILDIQKNELIERYKLELKYKIDKSVISNFSHESSE